MNEYRICLTPRSGFEITLHSDTLFGAICWGIRTLFGEARLLDVLEEFSDKPPFLLSSAFPWKETREKKEYFLPKPCLNPILSTDFKTLAQSRAEKGRQTYHTGKFQQIELANSYKRFKKLQWLPERTWRKVLKGAKENDLFLDFLDKIFRVPNFCESGIVQKNSLDRLANSTAGSGNTFFAPDIGFRKKHGLYFFLKTADIDSYLWPVLQYLQDSGIGPNARTGRNWFTVEKETTAVFEGTKGESFITLSRCIGLDGMDADRSRYKLVSVRSKVESRQEFAGEDVWKDRVTYFAAGSLLIPRKKKDFYGGIVPVKKIVGKTVYQYGYAYPVWIGGEGEP